MSENGKRWCGEGLGPAAAALLTRVQSHIPLSGRPFRELGDELGLSEADTLSLMREFSDRRLIRQISGIFDGAALGYQSCLVACKYTDHVLERAAQAISSHPGVSHNYRRQHEFNLWYTIAVPPGQDLKSEVQALDRLTGPSLTRLLPARRLFKLGVRLAIGDQAGANEAPSGVSSRALSAEPGALSDVEVQAVRALQDPLPLIDRPFDRIAINHGFGDVEELLAVGEDLHRRGVLRRFAAVLRHRLAGYQANGMVVWKVSPEECARAGEIMARYANVSHCYERPTYPDWPYRLFTMIHGRTREEVEECVAAIADETGLREWEILYSDREFKKARVRYFTEDWERWRAEVERWGAAAQAPRSGSGAVAGGGASVRGMSPQAVDRMRIWGHLQSLQACLWDITSLPREDLDAVRESAKLHADNGMLLSTCQRLEAYSLPGCNCGASRRLYGLEALLHLAEVAAGLHSVVLGEEQIAGQVRAALAVSPAGVRELGDIALAAAREIRREAAFESHAGHLLDRGLKASGTEARGRLLVVGTGHMGRLISRRGRELGFEAILVAGRRRPEGRWVEEAGAEFVPLTDLRRAGPVEVAVGCLGSEADVLDVDRDLPPVRNLVLDLGTPRNFASDGTPVLTIEALFLHERDTGHRAELVAELRARLRKRLEERLAMAAADSRSTIGAVRLALEMRRREELKRISRLHPEIAPDTLDVITKSLVNHLLHGFSMRLKEIDDAEFHERLLYLFQDEATVSGGSVASRAG